MKTVKKLLLFSLFSFVLLSNFSTRLTAALSTKAEMPEFLGAAKWFNSEVLPSRKNLAGKVILIDFWSPSNLRNLRRIGILKEWYARYRYDSFEIIGVLTPEFNFEKDPDRLTRVIKKLKIEYPIAIDSERKIRQIYNATEPQTTVLIESDGRIHTIFTEQMDYAKTELLIQTLIKQANPYAGMPEEDIVNVPTYEFPLEFVFGYKKMAGYGNDQRLLSDMKQTLNLPRDLTPGKFYLTGAWISKEENLTVSKIPASLTALYAARNIFLVAGSQTGSPLPVEVLLNGSPVPQSRKGKDLVFQAGKSFVFVDDHRIYDAVKFSENPGEQKLELRFEEPGVEIFIMSFE